MHDFTKLYACNHIKLHLGLPYGRSMLSGVLDIYGSRADS
jgi:hypothetical protein